MTVRVAVVANRITNQTIRAHLSHQIGDRMANVLRVRTLRGRRSRTEQGVPCERRHRGGIIRRGPMSQLGLRSGNPPQATVNRGTQPAVARRLAMHPRTWQ